VAYSAVAAQSFTGGLNLRDSYEQMEGNQSYDLRNVTFDVRGGVKQRAGFGSFAPSSSGTNRYDSLAAFYTTGGVKQLVCGAGNRLEVFDSTGAAVSGGVSTSPTASPHFFARFGGPTEQALYASNGTNQARKWSGSAWTTPTILPGGTGVAPTGKFLAVTPWDNRMVNACRSGSTAGDNASTVRFSDPSLPDTWLSYNWVDVNPGDGESITGLCVFDNYLIVFKESRFFVFYGTGISADDGTPEFSYRAVEAGVGLVSSGACCVAPDGVYFLARNGVYRTNGSLPVLVSSLIEPLFVGDVPSLYSGLPLNPAAVSLARMCYHNQLVYVSVATGSSSVNSNVFVLDLRNGAWSVWDIGAAALCTFKASSQPDLMFAYSSGSNLVGRVSSGFVDDAGVKILSWIKLAFNSLGSSGHKTIRESKVWGSGNVRFSIADDFSSASNVEEVDFDASTDRWGDGGSDTWGDGTGTDTWTKAASSRAVLVRNSVRGTYVSVELYSSNLATSVSGWSVKQIVHHVRDNRVPSVTNVDGE
jgi:hypothetical protein